MFFRINRGEDTNKNLPAPSWWTHGSTAKSGSQSRQTWIRICLSGSLIAAIRTSAILATYASSSCSQQLHPVPVGDRNVICGLCGILQLSDEVLSFKIFARLTPRDIASVGFVCGRLYELTKMKTFGEWVRRGITYLLNLEIGTKWATEHVYGLPISIQVNPVMVFGPNPFGRL
ncbi:hypothetical protein VNO77_20384 [Canavalia gladiata]|uniref:F-box domain-containing protein n=1 Tax=Canavalia gladiata TaxID=3824 RepID=A0AAN9LT31_CANGL